MVCIVFCVVLTICPCPINLAWRLDTRPQPISQKKSGVFIQMAINYHGCSRGTAEESSSRRTIKPDFVPWQFFGKLDTSDRSYLEMPNRLDCGCA